MCLSVHLHAASIRPSLYLMYLSFHLSYCPSTSCVNTISVRLCPQVAAEIAAPLSQAKKVTMVSSGNGEVGAAKLTGEVLTIMNKLPEVIEGMTGINISKVCSVFTCHLVEQWDGYYVLRLTSPSLDLLPSKQSVKRHRDGRRPPLTPDLSNYHKICCTMMW